MPHDGQKLQMCIRLALQGHTPKDLLLRLLADYLCNISSSTWGPHSCSSRTAARAIKGLPADHVQLKQLVMGTEVIKVQQTPGGDTIIQLDADALVRKARNATKTGILTEELPPAVGYVDDVHPKRPGQRDCKQWVQYAECSFGTRCVFNHPGMYNAVCCQVHLPSMYIPLCFELPNVVQILTCKPLLAA